MALGRFDPSPVVQNKLSQNQVVVVNANAGLRRPLESDILSSQPASHKDHLAIDAHMTLGAHAAEGDTDGVAGAKRAKVTATGAMVELGGYLHVERFVRSDLIELFPPTVEPALLCLGRLGWRILDVKRDVTVHALVTAVVLRAAPTTANDANPQ